MPTIECPDLNDIETRSQELDEWLGYIWTLDFLNLPTETKRQILRIELIQDSIKDRLSYLLMR